MKDIYELYESGLEILNDCGISVGDIKELKINSRATSRWGRCTYRRKSDDYVIELSKYILGDDSKYDAVLSTMVHELLHAVPGSVGHGTVWKRNADKIMKKYPNLTIQRTMNADDYQIRSIERNVVRTRYAIKCSKCGMIHYSSRMSKSIQHPDWYHCGKCGGQMERMY